ncbi:MAG: hypothetical protein U1F36_14765 [Planctomycetota bacterium]
MKTDNQDSFDAIDERERMVQRYVDELLDPQSRAAFEARLAADPSLRGAVDDLRSVRSAFRAAARVAAPLPSADFRARVMARAASAAEETPTFGTPTVDQGVIRWARRVLIAAAVIAVVSLAFLSGALRRADDGRLQASEADVQKAMADLDAQMRAAASAPHAEGR